MVHTDAIYIYDPRADRWSSGLRLPFGQECAAATFTSGEEKEVIFLGGWPDRRKIPIASVVALNPKRQTWRSLPSLPIATAAANAVTIRETNSANAVYLLGGMPGSTELRKLSL